MNDYNKPLFMLTDVSLVTLHNKGVTSKIANEYYLWLNISARCTAR